MVEPREIEQKFIEDSLRLCREAGKVLASLERQALQGRLRSPSVRAFYERLHAVKGAALMLDAQSAVAQILQGLEGTLACRSLAESAADLSWLPEGRRVLAAVEGVLREWKAGVSSRTAPVRVWALRCTSFGAGSGGREILHPSERVVEVLSSCIWSEDGFVEFEGKRIPVRGIEGSALPEKSPGVVLRAAGDGSLWVEVIDEGWSWALVDPAALERSRGSVKEREAA